jgi:hypothetical protein
LDANEQFSSFLVTVGGQTVNMTPLQAFPSYTLYGGNISAWAGHGATLSITEELPDGLPGQSPSVLELDNIFFSTQSVPEPGPAMLTGIGALVFSLFRRIIKRR